MRLLTVLRRRLRTHVLAFVAVLVTVLMSMLVVATLQLLSGAISDAGVRSSLSSATSGNARAERTVWVSASVKQGTLGEADRLIRERFAALGGELTVSRVAHPTVRGIQGGDATARAQLADVEGLKEAVDLVAGRWPEEKGAGGTIEVAMPEEAARALSLALGKTLVLPSLTSDTEKPLTVTLVGTYRVRDFTAAVWLDDDLSPVGVRKADYTTYGPLVLAPGVFDSGAVGPSPVTWRASIQFDDATPQSIQRVQESFGGGLAALKETVGDARDAAPGSSGSPSPLFSSGRVETGLPEHLATASLVAERIKASLLTPVVLLIVLGASSLVMAARLLVGLRSEETRLMRTRGMSTRQLTVLGLADSALVVVPGIVGALLVAPLLTDVIGRTAGVSLRATSIVQAATDGGLWLAVGTMAVLTIVVIVGTSLRSGVGQSGLGAQSAKSVTGSRVPALLSVLSGAGLDLALVGLGVLAVIQLRRYDAAGSTTVDPLTIAAPACIIAGLAVLCLRLLPGAARQTERISVGHVGLDRAWGAWQLSRRLAAQGGTIVLILLCVAMGTVALAHSATAERAIVDQSAFENGAPLRVDSLLGRPLADRAVGGSDRAMPVLRTAADLRTVTGVTELGVDASKAGTIAQVRADLLGDQSWSDLMRQLGEQRPEAKGVTLPANARVLTVGVRFRSTAGTALPTYLNDLPVTGQVMLRDAQGLVLSATTGLVRTTATPARVELTSGGQPLVGPVKILAFTATLPSWMSESELETLPLGLEITELLADGKPVAGADTFRQQSMGIEYKIGSQAPTVKQLPVVLTQQLAGALGAKQGATLSLPIAGRTVSARVVGVVDAVPTAADAHMALLYDLPTFSAMQEQPGADPGWPTGTPMPGEWWLHPKDPASAATALRSAGVPLNVTKDLTEVEAARRLNPVNAGLQAAMLLVTGAALVLAAVGFAATTASLARARHHENAILLALGMPPGRIRRVLTIERMCVVVLTVLAGVVMGVVAAWLVVPFLVGGDGHAQVPEVVVVIPWGRLAALAAGITAVLALIGLLVLRRTGSDVAAELRMGEAR